MIADYPRELVLKDGSRITLKPMQAEDQERLLRFFRSIPKKDRWFLRDDVADADVVKGWADNLDYSHVLPILAEDGD